MKLSQSLLYLSLLLLTFSCTTQEQIQRAQMVDKMSEQLVQNQKISAESDVELTQVREELGLLNGKIQTLEHNALDENNQSLIATKERLNLVEEKNNQLLNDMSELKLKQEALATKVDEQSKFIKTVLGKLTKLGKPGKSSKKSLFDRAMSDYKKGRYKKSKKKLLTLFETKKLSASKKAHVIHNLGMISYIGRKNEKALFYFSKLFTEYPKSGFNRNGLYHLGKTFTRLKKSEEANQTYSELIKRFPKSKMAKKAIKLIQ